MILSQVEIAKDVVSTAFERNVFVGFAVMLLAVLIYGAWFTIGRFESFSAKHDETIKRISDQVSQDSKLARLEHREERKEWQANADERERRQSEFQKERDDKLNEMLKAVLKEANK